MSKQHIRIRFNLSEAALGFETLNKELLALPDEKAIRLRIMKILHDYSQSVSTSAIPFQTMTQLFKPASHVDLVSVVQAPPPVADAVVHQAVEISNSEAMRNAFKANGLEVDTH